MLNNRWCETCKRPVVPIDVTQFGLPVLVAMFAGAAAFVWHFGTRLTRQVDAIAQRTGLGHAFSGMLLLGGITSLPEVATVTTSAAAGNAPLAVNNLIGSAAINLLLLAVADFIYGRDALTKVAAKPQTLMQGVLGMILMASVAFAVVTREIDLFGFIGAWSLLLAAGCVWTLKLTSTFSDRHVWQVVDADKPEAVERARDERSTAKLYLGLAFTASMILVGGFFLSLSGDGIAQATGLSAGLIGFLLVGFGTSLPELSSITAAVRLKRYEMAVGDIFGTNLFNVALILLADVVYAGEPVLASAGRFESVGAIIAVLLTGVFVIGLLERRDRTILRMGIDSLTAIVVFAVGLYGLAEASRQTPEGQPTDAAPANEAVQDRPAESGPPQDR